MFFEMLLESDLFSHLVGHIEFQEANRRNNNWLPPPWAILALVVLGFNEFMTLLRYSLPILLN